MAEEYSIAWTYHILFIRLSIDGHLGCHHPDMNSASGGVPVLSTVTLILSRELS